MSDRLQMVVGLCFDLQRNVVALVLKARGPQCVIGNWNGVGGKIEPGETPVQAMRREFLEETDVDIPEGEWTQFACLVADDYDLFFFDAATPQVFNCTTVEEEQIKVWNCRDLGMEQNLMSTIRWMVPFLQDRDVSHDLGLLSICR